MPEGDLVTEGGNQRVSTNAAEIRGADLDRDAIAEIDSILRNLADDHGRDHRRLGNQRGDVAEDDASLPTISGDDEHGATFAGHQTVRPDLEHGEIDRNQREDERFASAATDYQPGLDVARS
ncbi:hypothetical protein [Nitrobacter sp. TKz-YC02]|uniref:hypothetical protein n=1 Tax=Nitrobacter sp. TKz-YC02 TaxID=3398704 RepID=UPI003CE7A649